MVNCEGIGSSQSMEVVVTGPGGANRMFIYTGIAGFNFKGQSGSFRYDSMEFEIGRIFSRGQVLQIIAIGSLNRVFNNATAVNAGWSIENINGRWDAVHGRVMVHADLGCSDSDGYLQKMGFQVIVLAKV